MKKEKRIKKDAKILKAFIGVYCRENHNKPECHPERSVKDMQPHSGEAELCQSCSELLEYALKRDEKCPLDPKPMCKKCHVHCYKPEMREKIRKVMKFSGKYAIKHGRLDLIFHYFF